MFQLSMIDFKLVDVSNANGLTFVNKFQSSVAARNPSPEALFIISEKMNAK